MTELVAASANLRVLIYRIEEAVAFNLPLEQVPGINEVVKTTEAFLNALALTQQIANEKV